MRIDEIGINVAIIQQFYGTQTSSSKMHLFKLLDEVGN